MLRGCSTAWSYLLVAAGVIVACYFVNACTYLQVQCTIDWDCRLGCRCLNHVRAACVAASLTEGNVIGWNSRTIAFLIIEILLIGFFLFGSIILKSRMNVSPCSGLHVPQHPVLALFHPLTAFEALQHTFDIPI